MNLLKSITEMADQDDLPTEKTKYLAIVLDDAGKETEKKVKAFSVDDIKAYFADKFVSAELYSEQGEEAKDDDKPAADDTDAAADADEAADADLEESLFKSVVTEASLGSRVGFDSYEEWDLSLPPKHTMHRDGKIKRAQARGKDFEGVAGQWDEEKMEGWIYTYYLKKENLAEAKLLNFPTFYSFCLQHGVSEDELDDVIDNAYNQDTDEFVLAKEVKDAIGKADIKSAKEKALKAIKFLTKFTITGTGPGAKKAQALVDKFAEAAYKHLVAHWADLNEEAPILKAGLAQDLAKVLKGLGYKLDSKESTTGELKSWWVHPSQKHEISAAALAKALAALDPSVKVKPNYQFPQATQLKNANETHGDLLRASFQSNGMLFVSVYKKKPAGELAKRDIARGLDPDMRNEGLTRLAEMAKQSKPARRGAQASKRMFQVKFNSTWEDKELHFDDLQDIVDRINHPLHGPGRTDLSELTELVEEQIGDGANGGYGENAGTWDEIDFDVKSFSEDVLKITYTFGGVCFRKGIQYGETITKTGVITIMPGNANESYVMDTCLITEAATDDEMKTALLDAAAEMRYHEDGQDAEWNSVPEKAGKGFEISVRYWGNWEGDDGSGDYDFQKLSKGSSKELATILQQVEKRHPTVALTFQTGEKNWLYLYAK